MEEFPFAEATSLLLHARSELIPMALQEWFDRHDRVIDANARERILDRVRRWEIDAQLRVWLHTRASLRTYRTLHQAFRDTGTFLGRSKPGDKSAMQLAGELLACQTLLNAARLALRGPIAV